MWVLSVFVHYHLLMDTAEGFVMNLMVFNDHCFIGGCRFLFWGLKKHSG